MNTNNLLCSYQSQPDYYFSQPIVPYYSTYGYSVENQPYASQEPYLLPLFIVENQGINHLPLWFQCPTYYSVSIKEVDSDSLKVEVNNSDNEKSETDHQNAYLKLEDKPEISIMEVQKNDQMEIKPIQDSKKTHEKLRSMKSKKNKAQTQYHPNRRYKQKSKKSQYLNENRNIIPNEINQIFSFIIKKKKSQHLLSRIMKKYPSQNESYSLNRFYLYQQMIKQKVGHYSTLNSLRLINQLYEPECRIWSEQQQRYYNKLCRMLIHHFLHEDSIFIILTSRKMKSSKKIDHLSVRRTIAEKIRQILSQP